MEDERVVVPILNKDGTLKPFTLKVQDGTFRCHYDCNVFNKPDALFLEIYKCNACGSIFSGE